MSHRGVIAAAAAPVAALVGLALLAAVMGADPSVSPRQPVSRTTTTTLNKAAIPNHAWVPWLIKGSTTCRGITAPELAAQDDQESHWNPRIVSPAGAEGIAQFMPQTWPAWAKDDDGTGNVTPFNPNDAIMAQSRDMCSIVTGVAAGQKAGKYTKAMSAYDLSLCLYNAGHLNNGTCPNIAQTQGYWRAIEALIPKYTAASPGPPPGPPGRGGTTVERAAMKAAAGEIGKPYCWAGGNIHGPTLGDGSSGPPCGTDGPGFDCSGLVQYAFYVGSRGAITTPRTAGGDAHYGTPVARKNLRPGDIIAFSSDGGHYFHHVGFYWGKGMLLNAPQDGMRVSLMHLSGWAKETWSIRRIG